MRSQDSGTHKTPAIKRCYSAICGFLSALHSRRRLNWVERLFALLTQKQLRREVHRSTRELKAAIRSYFEHYNCHPKPFIWAKAADQILRCREKTLARPPRYKHNEVQTWEDFPP